MGTIGRKLFTISEIYQNIYKAIISRKDFNNAIKNNLISNQFKERIMLAVTEVNKCDMCSYAHTKAALDSGMSGEEIQKILMGDLKEAPEDEIKGILFAQHYADFRGEPDSETWISLVKEYGKDKALGVLGVIRIIMVGNSLGIPLGSLKNRFKNQPDPRSSIGYELLVLLLTVPLFVLALIFSIMPMAKKFILE